MKFLEENLLIPEYGIMNGFCYAYSKQLLKKLQELIADGKTCNVNGNPSPICYAVLENLSMQISCSYTHHSPQNKPEERIETFADLVDEFLAIFRK